MLSEEIEELEAYIAGLPPRLEKYADTYKARLEELKAQRDVEERLPWLPSLLEGAEAPDPLRAASGSVNSDSKLVAFLYDLMRDHVPPGVVEEIIANSEGADSFEFTNGFIANYAIYLAKQLTGN